MVNENNCLLIDLYGTLIRNVFHVRRLKPAYMRSKDGSIISTKEQLKQALSIKDAPTLSQFRNALETKQIAITDDTASKESLPLVANYNMHCTQLNQDVNIQLPLNEQKSKANNLPAGEYSIVKSRFKDGNLEVLLTRSHEQHDRKQAFFLKYTELPQSQSEDIIDEITSARITGRPH